MVAQVLLVIISVSEQTTSVHVFLLHLLLLGRLGSRLILSGGSSSRSGRSCRGGGHWSSRCPVQKIIDAAIGENANVESCVEWWHFNLSSLEERLKLVGSNGNSCVVKEKSCVSDGEVLIICG